MDANELLHQALNLPTEARAALAVRLIESLDDEIDPDAERLWAQEISQRLREFDEGHSEAFSWPEVRDSILKR